MSVMLGLGSFRFSISTAAYQTLSRSTDYRWQAQDRFGRRPALQFVGIGRDTIDLQGVIFPHFRGGLGQIDRMRSSASGGEPMILVDGRGRVHGKFVITRVAERNSLFDRNGDPRQMEFTLSLEYYGEDR